MTESSGGATVRAGWFPDPAGSVWLRWWDGANWTEHFIDPATGQPPSATVNRTSNGTFDDGTLTRRELREIQEATTAAMPVLPGAPVIEPPAQHVESFAPADWNEPAVPDAVDTPHIPVTTAAPFAPVPPGFGPPDEWVIAPPPRAEDAYILHPAPVYVPMSIPDVETPAPAQDLPALKTSTVPIWLFAVLPVLHLALVWFVFDWLKPADTSILRWVVIAGPIVIYLVLAALDHRRLLARGHIHLAPALLALIPLLYLGIRAARLGARAIAPVLVWLLLQAATVAALIVLFPGIVTQLTASDGATPASSSSATPLPTADTHVLSATERAALLTPTGMAAQLKTQFATQGVTLKSVRCPPLESTVDGTQVTCSGTLANTTLDIVVAVDNVNTFAAFDIISSLPHAN